MQRLCKIYTLLTSLLPVLIEVGLSCPGWLVRPSLLGHWVPSFLCLASFIASMFSLNIACHVYKGLLRLTDSICHSKAPGSWYCLLGFKLINASNSYSFTRSAVTTLLMCANHLSNAWFCPILSCPWLGSFTSLCSLLRFIDVLLYWHLITWCSGLDWIECYAPLSVFLTRLVESCGL